MDESRTSPVRLQGKVLNWFFEGDAGCYITLTDDDQQIEARAEADDCEFMKVPVNDVIDLELFYDPKQDYGDKDNPMFTVKRFFTK